VQLPVKAVFRYTQVAPKTISWNIVHLEEAKRKRAAFTPNRGETRKRRPSLQGQEALEP